MLSKLKEIFWKIYKFNNPYYKKNFYGSFDKFRLAFINFVKPGRLINRLRYGQLFKNTQKQIKKFSQSLRDKNFQDISKEKKEKLEHAIKNLFEDGGCVIQNYFTKNEVQLLKSNHEDIIKNLKKDNSNDRNIHNADIIPLSDNLLNIWLDKGLMLLLENYHGRSIFARNYPYLIYSKVSSNYSEENSKVNEEIRWAKDWHVDHSVLFNVHVVLDDIGNNDSRMQILKRSDKFNHYGSNFSKELVDNSNFEKIDCVGSAGTVYLHSGNVVHRFNPEPGSDRLVTHFEFSPGSNILMNTKGIVKSLKNFDIDKIQKEKLNIIYPIFPKNLFKGYDVKGNSYIPTRFKGI